MHSKVTLCTACLLSYLVYSMKHESVAGKARAIQDASMQADQYLPDHDACTSCDDAELLAPPLALSVCVAGAAGALPHRWGRDGALQGVASRCRHAWAIDDTRLW